MNVVNILKKCAKEYQNKPAVIFRQQEISFLQLKDKVFSFAGSLLKLGVMPHDKIAIYLPNWPEYIISYLAIWSIGACCVPLDFMLTEDEIVSCLEHSEAKILITKHKANISFINLKAKVATLKNIISCQSPDLDSLRFDDFLTAKVSRIPKIKINDSDYAIIFYTSGTTGKPKGVLINYAQLDGPPKSMAFFVNSDLSAQDTTLCALPFSHLGGLIYIQNMISFGMKVVHSSHYLNEGDSPIFLFYGDA